MDSLTSHGTTRIDTADVERGDGVIAVAASVDNWIALGIAVAASLYLFVVLLHPERF